MTYIVTVLKSHWLFIVMCDRLGGTELINDEAAATATIFHLIKSLLCYRFSGGYSYKNMLFNLAVEILVGLFIKVDRLHVY